MLDRIEQGSTEALPAEVFVCGFLRAYAREVGVDAGIAVASYRKTLVGNDAVIHEIDKPATLGAVEPEAAEDETPSPKVGVAASIDGIVEKLTAKIPAVEGALGRGPTFALVVLLVVLVATITLSLLLGGDPTPGRGLS